MLLRRRTPAPCSLNRPAPSHTYSELRRCVQRFTIDRHETGAPTTPTPATACCNRLLHPPVAYTINRDRSPHTFAHMQPPPTQPLYGRVLWPGRRFLACTITATAAILRPNRHSHQTVRAHVLLLVHTLSAYQKRYIPCTIAYS